MMESSTPSPTPRSPEELVHHTRWLRALALRMVQDEATADDLVQDTWVAVLRHPPQRLGIRAWLKQVLVNAARQRERSNQRRDRREEVVAREEAVPLSAEDLVERIELQKRLLSEVGRLAEPYRTVVLLRYDEDLTAADIARRLGRSPATVRTQLKRGLERLRERMDETSGGREAWASLLVPAAFLRDVAGGGASAASIQVATPEVLTMSVTTKMGIATAATVVCLAGVFGLRSPEESGGRGDTATLGREERTGESATQMEDVAGSTAPRVERVAAATEAPVAAATALEVHALEARIVDAEGHPIAGAVMELEGGDPSGPSDREGRARLPLPEAGLLDERGTLRIEAAGYQAMEIDVARAPGERTWLGDITLLGGAWVQGVVIDEDELPVANAEVLLIKSSSLANLPRLRRTGPELGDDWDRKEARTDARGRFRFEAFETGSRTLWAKSESTLWTIEGPLRIGPGDALDLTLRLEEAEELGRLAGIVRDPSGNPVPGAWVQYYDDPGRGFRGVAANDEGRFDIVLEFAGPHSVRASHPERLYPEIVQQRVAPGTTDLELRFENSRTLILRGRGASGELELDNAYARAVDDDMITAGSGTTGDGGRTLLEPVEPFYLVASAAGHAERRLGPFSPGTLDSPFVIDLVPTGAVNGHVFDGARPVAGAKVELFEATAPTTRVSHGGLPLRRSPHPLGSALTEDDGSFSITPRGLRAFYVRVETPDHAPAETLVEDFDTERGSELVFELEPGGSLTGVVVPLPGRAPTGLFVIAHRGDGREHVTRLGPDGLFSFEHLVPGRWMVETANEYEDSPATTYTGAREPFDELPWNVEVGAGEESFLEIDLADRETAVLVGEVHVDGEPASDWIAQLLPRDGRMSAPPDTRPHAKIDDFGGFHLETTHVGESQLSLTSADSALVLRTPLQLEGGETEWSLDIETGSVSITGLDPDFESTTRPRLVWKRGDVSCQLNVARAPHGRARFERVPAGELRLLQYVRVENGLREVLLAQGTLRAGATLEMRVED